MPGDDKEKPSEKITLADHSGKTMKGDPSKMMTLVTLLNNNATGEQISAFSTFTPIKKKGDKNNSDDKGKILTQEFDDDDKKIEPIAEEKLKKLEVLTLDALVNNAEGAKAQDKTAVAAEVKPLEEVSFKEAPSLRAAGAANNNDKKEAIEILSYKEVADEEEKSKDNRKQSANKRKKDKKDPGEQTKEGPSDQPKGGSSPDINRITMSREVANELGVSPSSPNTPSVSPTPTTLSSGSMYSASGSGKMSGKSGRRRRKIPKGQAISSMTRGKKEGIGYASGPDKQLLLQSCYHGYAELSYVDKTLQKDGEFMICILTRTIEEDAVQCVCLVVRHQKDLQIFNILHKKGKGYIFTETDSQAFEFQGTLVSHYFDTKQPIPSSPNVYIKMVAKVPWHIVPHEKVVLDKKLGQGQFGDVHKAVINMNNMQAHVAVKTLKDSKALSAQTKEEFLTEAYTMMSLRHENIVKIVGIATLHTPLMIILEYMPGGNLRSYLRKNAGKLSLPKLLRFCIDSSHGMKYIESQKLIHRDVAARNCLLFKKGDKGHLKISDFGLTIHRNAVKSIKCKSMTLPIKWLAPEILREQLFSSKSDVWAYGVMLTEIFNDGKEPYPGISNSEIRKRLVDGSGYRMKLPDKVPRAMADMIQKCWHEKPAQRPPFAKIDKVLSLIGKFIIDPKP